LRGCDLVKIKIGSFLMGPEIRFRAFVVHQKTPIGFNEDADNIRARGHEAPQAPSRNHSSMRDKAAQVLKGVPMVTVCD
jgi:hypothetical protein